MVYSTSASTQSNIQTTTPTSPGSSYSPQTNKISTLFNPETSSPISNDLSISFANMSIEEQRRLLDLFKKNVEQVDSKAIEEAIQKGKEAILALLSENKVDPSSKKNALMVWAAENGDEEVMRILLKDRRVDPAVQENHPLRLAVRYNHHPVVRLLIADPRVNPNECCWITEWACTQGSDAIKLLLANPNYVPDDKLINWTCDQNHPDILVLLLMNPKVNFQDGNLRLVAACMKGHTDIVRVLLTDPRVDPTHDNEAAFKRACGSGHIECVKCLLEKGVNPTSEENWAIRYAGNGEVARLLLKDPRVDPTAHNSDAVLMASFHGKVDVVRELLKDGRADPTMNMCVCLVSAHSNKHDAVVAELLSDERVNPNRHTTYKDWFKDPSRINYMKCDPERVKIKMKF